jgi:hypothetical protein
MGKATAKDIQDLLTKINTPSVEGVIHREQWIAKLQYYAKYPEELEDDAAKFAAENAMMLFRS